MTVTAPENGSSGWKRFFRKHWPMLILLVAVASVASVGAVYVFLWFVGNAESTGLVPGTLGLWAMGNVVTFLLNAIFWELLFMGIPVILGVVAGWLWWRRLPIEEREAYHFTGGPSRSANGGGAVSFLFWIAFWI
jgi:hypothetical protein